MAVETNSEAYLPVILSLGKLYMRSIWHTLMGGQGGLSLWGSDEEISKNLYFSLVYVLLKASILAKPTQGKQIEERKQATSGEQVIDDEYREEEDGPWYFGKAKEEFQRRSGQITNPRRRRGEEEDPIQVRSLRVHFLLTFRLIEDSQWARERRDADREREGDFGPEDYFDGTMRGGNRDDAELDEFGETMVLVVLCLVISILLYIRTRIVERMRRDQREQGQAGDQQAPPNGPDGGVFPPPGDPARNDWAILR